MSVPEVSLPEFSRAFALRTPRLGLFLGAGASITSGVASAGDLVWDFKRNIYASENHIHPLRVGPLADPSIRHRIQMFFDAKTGFPTAGEDSEYSFYFERAYRDPSDRRLFIDRQLQGKRPAHGYLCLGVLLAEKRCRIVWTTNFDDLAEQAYSVVSEGKSVSLVGRDTSGRLDVLLRDERFPIVVKLHGDFKVDLLQNTTTELTEFDDQLREHLVEWSRHNGLVIVGYSGRDSSVMTALESALTRHGNRAFPEGIYWCLREGDICPPRAHKLLSDAINLGIRASRVRIPDFDDLAASLYQACGLNNMEVDTKLYERQKKRTGYTLTYSSNSEPILKLNAIAVSKYPESCYRFKSNIKTWEELRQTVGDEPIVAILHGGYVHALGHRLEIERIFGPVGLSELHPAPITRDDLQVSDSKILGLFYDALIAGLTTASSPLASTRGRRRVLYIKQKATIPKQIASLFTNLNLRASPALVHLARSKDHWVHEAVEVALDYREGRLWLLFRPTVYLTTDGNTRWDGEAKKEVIRELLALRYNRQASGLFTFWLRLFETCTTDGTVRFPPSHEASFEFKLSRGLGTSYHEA